MLRFVLVRTAGLLVVVFAMVVGIFLLRQVVPGDPARAAVGPTAPQDVVEAKRAELGLDDQLSVQFGRYLRALSHGDLGQSIRTRNPVREDLAVALPASVELMAFALLGGVVLGGAFAFGQHLLPRLGALRLLLVGGASAPIFLTALLLLLLFWYRLGWLPGGGRGGSADGPTGLMVVDGLLGGSPAAAWGALRHLILPATALALPMAVAIGRTLRSALATVLAQDHIRTARSKGLSEQRILLRHALRNASTAPLAMLGLQVGLLFANLLIVEQIFAWPGLGLYTVQALSRSDLPAVLGVSLLFGTAYVLLNALIDLAQAWADPRVGLSRS